LKRCLVVGVIALSVAMLCAVAQAGVGVETFFPADMDPVLSPDGSEVAYVSQRGPIRSDGSIVDPVAWTGLYLRDLNVQGERRLAQSGFNLGPPAWTPDSKQLIFPASSLQGKQTSGTALYRYDLPSDTFVRLTGDDNSTNSRPLVSPDGSLVAYLHMDPQTSQSGLWLMNRDGSNERSLIPFASSRVAVQGWAFAGDSTSIYYLLVRDQVWELHRVSVDGSVDQLLFTRNVPFWDLQVSPDGTWLSWIDGSGGDSIEVAPTSAPSTPFTLVTSESTLSYYAWSPSSDGIVYAQVVHPVQSNPVGVPLVDLYVTHLPGPDGAGDSFRITRGAYVVGDISWHGEIVFTTEASGCLQGIARSAGAPDEVGPQSGFIRLTNDCHLNGTATHDRIPGSPYRDIIQGLGGNDTITGGGGIDLIYGGDGNDTIIGGSGNDTIVGGTGNDHLTGGYGSDVVSGGLGRDIIDGGSGNDTIYAHDGAKDTINCGETKGVKHDRDIVYADRIDAVASNCERVIR
jgi:RTX calcium-binding nonapeptide repeat (4 copies)/WD40-like Beta Propeller Repeat